MKYKIITFYEFKHLSNLEQLKLDLKSEMIANSIFGTIIIATEGVNSTLCADEQHLSEFISKIENILETKIDYKSSFYKEIAFQRQKVKIKSEIITLRKSVDIKKGVGTHVNGKDWNEILSDPQTLILDTRNDYEYRVGTFNGAINPKTKSFNELPKFVEENLDPKKHRKIALFCTGGIRCEKFAPYMKEKGFEGVYQLEGGILSYLKEMSKSESRWKGECFVFDGRVTVDEILQKGEAVDYSVDKNKLE